METEQLPILGGYNKYREIQYDSERTVNMYDVVEMVQGKPKGFLRRFEGLKSIITSMGTTNGRRLTAFGDFLYAVVAEKVFKIDTSLNVVQIGTLNTSSGFVGIEGNQKAPTPEVVFVDGIEVWVWNGATFTQVTTGDVPARPLNVKFQDGRLFIPNGETNYANLSDINNATTYQALNRILMQAKPDTVVGIGQNKGRIYLFGTQSIVAYYDAGGISPPFVPDTSFSPNLGCAAGPSIVDTGAVDAQGDGSIFFLGQTDSGAYEFMKISGSTMRKISTSALEDTLQTYTAISDCMAYVYTEGGHTFYQISFTTDNHTWVYDDTTDRWFEREMLNGSRYIGQDHEVFNGSHYVLGTNGTLYEMHRQYLDNNGESIRKLRRLKPFNVENRAKIKINRLDFFLNKGLGNLNSLSPEMRVRYSKSSGVYFGPDYHQDLTRVGDYTGRTIFRRNIGSAYARDIVIEFECTNSVDFNVFGGMMYYTALGV